MDKNRSDIRTQRSISVLTNNFDEKKGKTSSVGTIFAIVNFMVGCIVLLLPVNYQNSGIIFSTVSMLVIALITWKTASWIVIVSRNKPDLKRILNKYVGAFDYKIFTTSSFCLICGVGVIYFQLLNTTLYKIISTIFEFQGFENYAGKKEFTFEKFSMQWQAIAVFCVMYPLLFFKELKLLVQLGRVGACSIYAYIILIIYLFIDNTASGTLKANIGETKYFTKDIANILGNYALAFQSHNCIAEMMSQNKNQNTNIRNSKIVYIIGALVYGSIGILGTFALLGRKTSVEHPEDIFDFFADDKKNIPIFIVACIFLIHLITVYPLLCYLSKNALLNLVFEDKEVPKFIPPLYNTVFALTGVAVVVFRIDPNILVGIVGCIFGFVLIYFTPIRLRMNQKDIMKYEHGIDEQESEIASTCDDDEEEEDLEENFLNKSKVYVKKGYRELLSKLSIRLKLTLLLFLCVGLSLSVINLTQLF